jgi:hypothetical protein
VLPVSEDVSNWKGERVMTDPVNATANEAGFKDRRAGLIAFGILQIILGVICALIVPFMVLGMMMSAPVSPNASVPQPDTRMMIPGLVFYLLLAAWFIWMGIGSVMARRWARALVLVASWMWLIAGVMATASMVFIMPGMFAQMNRNDQMPEAMISIFKAVMFGVLAVFYVIIPGLLVLFYGSRHVKATCESRDPTVRWTDRCPLPVLALSVVSVIWACCMPMMGIYGWALPFFGLIVNGAAGAAVALVTILLLAYVAWGAYRLNIKAWWCAVAMVTGWGLSAGVTFSRVSLMDFYGKMNFPAEQIDLMKQMMPSGSSWLLLLMGAWFIILLGYLIYTKRFFDQQARTGAVTG